MAKIVAPSVLTMSGSSTPASWLFVVEKLGELEVSGPPAVADDAEAAGAAVPTTPLPVTAGAAPASAMIGGSGYPWVVFRCV